MGAIPHTMLLVKETKMTKLTTKQANEMPNIYYDASMHTDKELNNTVAFFMGSVNKDMIKAIFFGNQGYANEMNNVSEATIDVGFYNGTGKRLTRFDEADAEMIHNDWCGYDEVAISYLLKANDRFMNRENWSKGFVKEINRIKREHACKVSWVNCRITFIFTRKDYHMESKDLQGVSIELLEQQLSQVVNPIEHDPYYDPIMDTFVANVDVERECVYLEAVVGGIKVAIDVGAYNVLDGLIRDIRGFCGEYFGIAHDRQKSVLSFELCGKMSKWIHPKYNQHVAEGLTTPYNVKEIS